MVHHTIILYDFREPLVPLFLTVHASSHEAP
jgi:hypothetical protein